MPSPSNLQSEEDFPEEEESPVFDFKQWTKDLASLLKKKEELENELRRFLEAKKKGG